MLFFVLTFMWKKTSGSDRTVATAASALISLAAAGLTVASSVSSLLSAGFKASLQESLLDFVTACCKLVGCATLKRNENASDWSF